MRNRKYTPRFRITRSAIGHHHDGIFDVVVGRINFLMLGIENHSRDHPQERIRPDNLAQGNAHVALARTPFA